MNMSLHTAPFLVASTCLSTSPCIFLTNYRRTPGPISGQVPAEARYGLCIRTIAAHLVAFA